jgi:hypothetical protein
MTARARMPNENDMYTRGKQQCAYIAVRIYKIPLLGHLISSANYVFSCRQC